MAEPKPPAIYGSLTKIIGELAKHDFVKLGRNEKHQYSYLKLPQVYEAVAPQLAKHNVAMLPRVISRECEARTTKNNGIMYFVTLVVEFDFVSGEDGSKHTIVVIGEGSDTGDKASNKALSAAYKYACINTFSIASDEPDADKHSTEETVEFDWDRWLKEYGALIDAAKNEAELTEIVRPRAQTTNELLKENPKVHKRLMDRLAAKRATFNQEGVTNNE